MEANTSAATASRGDGTANNEVTHESANSAIPGRNTDTNASSATSVSQEVSESGARETDHPEVGGAITMEKQRKIELTKFLQKRLAVGHQENSSNTDKHISQDEHDEPPAKVQEANEVLEGENAAEYYPEDKCVSENEPVARRTDVVREADTDDKDEYPEHGRLLDSVSAVTMTTNIQTEIFLLHHFEGQIFLTIKIPIQSYVFEHNVLQHRDLMKIGKLGQNSTAFFQ